MEDKPNEVDDLQRDFGRLSFEEKLEVDELSNQIDRDDPKTVVAFGSQTQSLISECAEAILQKLSGQTAMMINQSLSGLVTRMNELHVGEMDQEPGLLEKLPFVGERFSFSRRLETLYRKLESRIVHVVAELRDAASNLENDLDTLQNVYLRNQRHFEELNRYILAGRLKIDDLRDKLLPEMQRDMDENPASFDRQRINDLNQFLHRFEIKLTDLRLSRAISMQTAVQIRIVQNNNQALIEKIRSAIHNTIPLWKNQIAITLSILRQKRALSLHRGIADTTNALLRKNAEILRQTSAETVREQQRGIASIETLREVNRELLGTIETTLGIQEEGRKKRMEAEEELLRLERELKEKLVSLSPLKQES